MDAQAAHMNSRGGMSRVYLAASVLHEQIDEEGCSPIFAALLYG